MQIEDNILTWKHETGGLNITCISLGGMGRESITGFLLYNEHRKTVLVYENDVDSLRGKYQSR